MITLDADRDFPTAGAWMAGSPPDHSPGAAMKAKDRRPGRKETDQKLTLEEPPDEAAALGFVSPDGGAPRSEAALSQQRRRNGRTQPPRPGSAPALGEPRRQTGAWPCPTTMRPPETRPRCEPIAWPGEDGCPTAPARPEGARVSGPTRGLSRRGSAFRSQK